MIGMWKWISRRRHLRSQLCSAESELLQLRGIVAQLAAENAELRAIATQLDATVMDLSVQLWGPAAVQRAVDQGRRNRN